MVKLITDGNKKKTNIFLVINLNILRPTRNSVYLFCLQIILINDMFFTNIAKLYGAI